MQDNDDEVLAFAHLEDIDPKILEGRRGFPIENIGNIIPGQEVMSVDGDAVVGFILHEDDNDIYMFMPAETMLNKGLNGISGIGLQPYGFSPIIRINKNSVSDVVPIFYEKEEVYYSFVVNYIHSITPESMHQRMDRWIVYLTERIRSAKTASQRRSVLSGISPQTEPTPQTLAPDEISMEELELIKRQIKEQYGEDKEIKFITDPEEFERLAGLEEGSIEDSILTGKPPKKKTIH